MVEKIEKFIESGLKNNRSLAEIKSDLSSQGYLEADIERAVASLSKKLGQGKEKYSFKASLTKKVLLDRIGYGFGATQFINILFSMTGASLFFIGLINGIKSAMSTLFSSIMNEYTSHSSISRNFIRMSGLLFGFSFLFLGLSVSMRSDVLFAVALLLGSVGVVSYGDSFRNLMIKQAGKSRFLIMMSSLTFLGLLITAISLILSGLLMELIPVEGKMIYIFLEGGARVPYKIMGYIISFMITAFASIFSAHLLAKMKIDVKSDKINPFDFISFYIQEIKLKTGRFFKNKYLLIMTLTTLFIAIFQSVINSFVGIHIYYTYTDVWFKGFINVAVIYAIALMVSFAGPIIASRLNRYLGLTPLFVFGSLVMVILPLTIVFNPSSYFPAVLVATSLSVLGVAIIGSGHSLLASRLLNEKDRTSYYAASGLLTVIPFLVLVAVLSSFASAHGIISLFRLISFGFIIVSVPLYILLVYWSSKKY